VVRCNDDMLAGDEVAQSIGAPIVGQGRHRVNELVSASEDGAAERPHLHPDESLAPSSTTVPVMAPCFHMRIDTSPTPGHQRAIGCEEPSGRRRPDAPSGVARLDGRDAEASRGRSRKTNTPSAPVRIFCGGPAGDWRSGVPAAPGDAHNRSGNRSAGRRVDHLPDDHPRATRRRLEGRGRPAASEAQAMSRTQAFRTAGLR
jgi:hypothetical protein